MSNREICVARIEHNLIELMMNESHIYRIFLSPAVFTISSFIAIK